MCQIALAGLDFYILGVLSVPRVWLFDDFGRFGVVGFVLFCV